MTDTFTPDVEDDIALDLAATRARRALSDAADLIGYVRTLIVPSSVGSGDGMPRAASKEPPAPARLDAVDDSDAVWAQLVDWTTYWSGVFDVKPPASATAAWRNDDHEVQGFRPHTTPAGARYLVRNVIDWLDIRHDAIASKSAGLTYYEDVRDFLGALRARYPMGPRPARPVLPRPCPVCEHFTFGAEWTAEDPAAFVLRCDLCGHEEPGAEHLASAKRARELVASLREERQSWDRKGVLAFYDEHGYYPYDGEALDKRRSVPVCGAITYQGGRTLVCTLGAAHSGAHSGPGAEGERVEWEPKYTNGAA